ncbi:hypothetical protein DSOUD_3365 [Desulfuromonas soudanensis]|uniref:Uncharacterized protein n=1 Tax=Desulfuromonas soudanensis TaxID=1603606 RepID=A0A0M4D444_9BACT|nr:hypothetical protein [Desulfuromonas soudanensis]ALC18084.1 hypothetical protein DSOUD_3365 [Desulfuromonas soudanensis]
MILHPGILALICGTATVFLMLLYAGILAVKILRRWDFASSSEEQLVLERKTYLASTIVNYALGFEIFSLFLFIYTVDEIHPLFVGAMCATGVLNANPLGWYVLAVKIAIFFAAALWVALNFIDSQAEDVPLTRRKFAWLLLLAPLVGVELYLQIVYFLGLHPEVITSCCGSLFSSSDGGLAADMTALPVKPMMGFFYASGFLFLGSSWLCFRKKSPFFRTLFSLLAVIFFLISLASIVSFISLYIYELPTHHCPFDIFQKNYRFVGYPLYLGLFGGTLFGVLPGVFQPLKKVSTLASDIDRVEKKWIVLAVCFILLFMALASWPILFGPFELAGYPDFIQG